jgi:hypothetical protein
MITTFLAIIHNEVRHLWRRKSFWILQGVLSIPAIVYVIVNLIPESARVLGEYELPGQITLTFLLLLMPMLIGPSIIRDLDKIGDILWSTPLDGFTHLIATYSGLWLGLLPGIGIQTCIWWLMALLTPGVSPGVIWLYFLPLALIAMSLGLSMVILLALIIRRTLPLIIIWVALAIWLYLGRVGLDTFRPFQELSLLNINFSHLKISPSVGLGLYRTQVISLGIWFIGISLLVASLALLLYPLVDRRRTLRYRWTLPLSTLAAVGLMSIGYFSNVQAFQSQTLTHSPFEIQLNEWQVQEHILDVKVNAFEDSISGSSRLTLEKFGGLDQSSIVLKLNPGMEFIEIQDRHGVSLNVERDGDSIIVELPGPFQESITLQTTWMGNIHIPYTWYAREWWYDMPVTFSANEPEAIKGMLVNGVGFLMRDGDWYPWPWTEGPHQADTDQVNIEVIPENISTIPARQAGFIRYEGILPPVLLVLPPSNTHVEEDITLYAGKGTNSLLEKQLTSYARAAIELWETIGEQHPRHIIAMPYLSGIVLSENLLLIPEGTAFYHDPSIYRLYKDYVIGIEQSTLERAAMASLARAWLFSIYPPPPAPYLQALPSLKGGFGINDSWREAGYVFTESQWYEVGGRWIQPVDIPDVVYSWTPRRNETLTASGEFSAIGFWIASELGDLEVRQADLDLMLRMNSEYETQGRIPTELRVISFEYLWPYVLEALDARFLVLSLHDWATIIGQDSAIDLVITSVMKNVHQDVDALLFELEGRSGVPIEEGTR